MILSPTSTGAAVANVGDIDDDQVHDILYGSPGSACAYTCTAQIGETWCMNLEVSPLYSGQTGTFTVTYGQPNSLTFLAYSLQGPSPQTYVPGMDVYVDLVQPTQAGFAKQTNGQGKVSWGLQIAQQAHGRRFWCQAAQHQRKSRVVSRLVF